MFVVELFGVDDLLVVFVEVEYIVVVDVVM